jgi:NDP-sugar pyrophosphorylase family protein
MSGFHAVILAGGKGTRLRPYTVTLPKPLVPVGDRPVLEIILGQLRAAGVRRVTLAVNHLAELLRAYFGDGRKFGLAIDYSLEQEPLGTIGPLRMVPDLAPQFLVMNGDVLTDLDYRSFFEQHVRWGGEATVCAYQRHVQLDFGILTIHDGHLTGFQEKPRVDHYVSMGVYAFNRSVLAHVPERGPFGFDQLMLKLLEKGVAVRCYRHSGQWLDIGRPGDYERAQEFNLDGPAVDAV